MRHLVISTIIVFGFVQVIFAQSYRGNLSNNPYAPDSTSNPYGTYGNPYSPNSINNPFGAGNPYGNQKLELHDSQGNFRGNLNNNPYDPNSVSNPYGRFGNPYSPDSINNPFGAGNPFRNDSPNNPFGQGMRIDQRN